MLQTVTRKILVPLNIKDHIIVFQPGHYIINFDWGSNVGMDSFVPEDFFKSLASYDGSVNISAGIISTLQNFLKVAELMEAHRRAGISWGKLESY